MQNAEELSPFVSAFGSDQAVSNYPAIEAIDAQIEATKKSLRDLGYSEKEVNSLVGYAERLHDKEQYEKRVEEKAAYAKEHPVGASIGSVFENFLGFMDPVDTLLQNITNLVTGENIPTNEYTTAKQITGDVNAARDTVAGMIEDSTDSKFLSGLYKGGMTVADMAAQAGLMGIADGSLSALAKTAGTKGEALLTKLTSLWKTELKNTGLYDVGKLITGNAKATLDDAADLLADATLKKLDDVHFVDTTTLSKASSNEAIIKQLTDDWNGVNPLTNNPVSSEQAWETAGAQLAKNVNEGYNGKSFLDEVAGGAGETFTQGAKIPDVYLQTKPLNSPAVNRWLEGGGKIEINENGTWKYTNSKGISVTYKNSYPDFKGAGHVKQEIDIGPFKNRSSDFRLADRTAFNGPISPDSTWHHHEDGRTLQEVNKEIHRDFTHRGGISSMKK